MTAFLGVFVYLRDPKSALNRSFFLYCLAGSLWSFTEFGCRQAESFDRALFWLRAGALMSSAVPLELHFVIHFTERTWPERKLTYFLLYAPALAMSILEVTGMTAPQPAEVYWGWTYTPRQGLVQNLFDNWAIVISLCALALCSWYYLRKTKGEQKQQAGLVLAGLFIPSALAVLTEPGAVLSQMDIQVPELTSVGFIAECIIIVYAMQRYRLFALTPAAAADAIVATLSDALVLVNPEGKIAAINQATSALLGYEESELTDQPVGVILALEEIASFERTRLDQLAGAGPIHDTEVTFVTQSGTRIPVSVSASVVRDQHNIKQGVAYIGRDLTERKQAEEQIRRSLREKEILLKEIHHRVKNNLQVISSLLMLQSEEATDEGAVEMLRASQNRVYSMAIMHETLYQSEYLAEIDLVDYMQRLANHLVRSYQADPQSIAVQIDIGHISLSTDTAIQCGLIVNELVSNSLKHAFPTSQAGEISIGVQQEHDNQVILTVSDNGVGLPPDIPFPGTGSLGLQLVAMLIHQLEGKVEVERDGGTTFKIQFSASSQ